MRKSGPFLLVISAAAVAASITAKANSAQDAELDRVEIDQGWSELDRKRWYAGTQGSRLLPRVFFDALEMPNSDEKFNSPSNMERYRFLVDHLNLLNPYPVGFAVDRGTDQNLEITKNNWQKRKIFGGSRREEWIGLTCSACHTGEIEFDGKKVRVEGAPASIDFQAFEEDVALALRATHDEDAKFDRFAKAVIGDAASSSKKRQRLKDSLLSLTEWREKIVEINKTDIRYGYARLDAFGHIFNQVAFFTGADDPTFAPSNAPVSYPFLWNVPQHDRVQWNGIADNLKSALGVPYEALGRNTGEVIGVFGEVNVDKRSGPNFVKRASSSVFISNLLELERMLERLESPRWPVNVLGPIDEDLKERGRELFELKCSSCHYHLEPDDLSTPVIAQMSNFLAIDGDENPHPAPGTDPAMACNTYERRTASGFYEGEKFKDEEGVERRIGDEEQIAVLLASMVPSVIADQAGELILYVANPRKRVVAHVPGVTSAERQGSRGGGSAGERIADEIEPGFISPAAGDEQALESLELTSQWGPYAECMSANPSKLKGYKARPLNGIWATAPYLHNGSIPNLYEILLAPEKRSKTFHVGSRKFDPKNVGFVTEPGGGNSFRFDALNSDGSIRWGNFNGGHDYGNADLSEEDRWALVEYMKSL